jgi:hypothetical protein
MAWERSQLWAFVNMVMNLRVSQNKEFLNQQSKCQFLFLTCTSDSASYSKFGLGSLASSDSEFDFRNL